MSIDMQNNSKKFIGIDKYEKEMETIKSDNASMFLSNTKRTLDGAIGIRSKDYLTSVKKLSEEVAYYKKLYKEKLRNKIYNTKQIELVKTIETETNKLFANLPNKTELQNQLVFFCVNFTTEARNILTDTTFDIVRNFLVKENVKIKDISKQDIHRLIIILALSSYAKSDIEKFFKEAKKLQVLIENMDLIK
jgi:hypothetical protein